MEMSKRVEEIEKEYKCMLLPLLLVQFVLYTISGDGQSVVEHDASLYPAQTAAGTFV